MEVAKNMVSKPGVFGISILAISALLAACADDDSDAASPKDTEAEYAQLEREYPTYHANWPVRGEVEEIASTTPVIYHFDRSVKGLEPLNHIRFSWMQEVTTERGNTYDEETPVDFQVEFRNGGRTLVLIPDEELVPFREYRTYIPLKRDPETVPEYEDWFFERYYDTYFTISPRWEGEPEEITLNQDLLLNEELVPSMPYYTHHIKDQDLPILPFSSLTLEMSQPIDPSTVSYGDGPDDNIQLVQRDTREPLDIDVDVQVSGRYITLDPRQDLPESGEISIDLPSEGASEAIKSTLGIPMQASAFGGLTFGVTGEPGVDYEVLSEWPSAMTLRPVTSASDMTVSATNSAMDSAGNLLSLQDEDMAVTMTTIPKNLISYDRTYFSIERAERTPGERRLALLSDTYGVIYWRTHDRFADDDAKNGVKMYADIGIIDENGEVEASGRAIFHGDVHGEILDDNLVLDMYASLDPKALGQERLPGNGHINLKLKMTNTP